MNHAGSCAGARGGKALGLGIVLALMLAAASQAADRETLKASTVRITVEHSKGTSTGLGILLCQRGGRLDILTAKHVLTGQGLVDDSGERSQRFRGVVSYQVAFYRNSPLPIRVPSGAAIIREATYKDLALLTLAGVDAAVATVRLGDSVALRSGAEVESIDGDWDWTRGTVRSVGKSIHHSSNIDQGYAGGPVYNAAGEVVGLSLQTIRGVARAMPIEDAMLTVRWWIDPQCVGGATPPRPVPPPSTVADPPVSTPPRLVPEPAAVAAPPVATSPPIVVTTPPRSEPADSRPPVVAATPPRSVPPSSASPFREELSAFPWPAPQPSDLIVLSDQLPEALPEPGRATLGDFYHRLTDVLRIAGYDRTSLFSAPGGFVLVTRVERIEEDGKPLARRWLPDEQALGMWSRLRSFLFPETGYFRVFAFVVTDESKLTVEREATRAEATRWLKTGATVMPPRLASTRTSERLTVAALIYDFRQRGDSPAELRPAVARTHLEKAGVWSPLAAPR